MKAVVAGAGNVGKSLCRALTGAGLDVSLMDSDPASLEKAAEELDVQTYRGNAIHRRSLQEVGVSSAELFAAVTGSDETNLLAGALATDQGVQVAFARVDNPSFFSHENGVESGMESGILGIEAVVCSSRLISSEIMRLISAHTHGFVQNFLGNSVQVALVNITSDSILAGKSPEMLPRRGAAEAKGIFRDRALRPLCEIKNIEPGDAILLAGPSIEMASLLSPLAFGPVKPHALVVGGGDVGLQLVTRLQAAFCEVTLIEKNSDRCLELAEHLPHIRIVRGDGTDLSLLREEHRKSTQMVLSVAHSSEVNLMASLLAREIGISRSYALVQEPDFSDVYKHLGVSGTTSAGDVIARAVSWLLPRIEFDRGISLPLLNWSLHEILFPSSLPDGITLGKVPLPPGTLVLGLSRKFRSLPVRANEIVRPFDIGLFLVPDGDFKEVRSFVARTSRAKV